MLGGLFKAIDGLAETNITRVSKRVTSRGSHVDFLIEVAMKKGIIDVKLVDRPRTSSGNSKEEANSESSQRGRSCQSNPHPQPYCIPWRQGAPCSDLLYHRD